MSLTRDRQGYLENLDDMTLPQLKDLLERQEKILLKTKFLARLPDKGEKNRLFVERLKTLIYKRCDKDQNAKNGNNLKGNPHRLEDITGHIITEEETSKSFITMRNKDDATIEALLTRDETNVSCTSEVMETNNSEELVQQMQELSVGTESPFPSNIHSNSYERIIKKVEEGPNKTQAKFLPHRTKKEKRSSIPSSIPTTSNTPKVKEESAVCPPPYSHESTKLISIEESVHLIQEQRRRTEEIAAERAAQRLADQLSSSKMEKYQPSNVDMSYRQSKTGHDEEQDSDDYPSDDDIVTL